MSALKDVIVSNLQREPGLAAVALFGSQLTGSIRDDSDVDVAVLFQHKMMPSPVRLIELRESLADDLNMSVDLVCLNTCSPIIGMQILQHGDLLLSLDSTTYNKYLMRLFSEYHDLKYMRKPAEDAILERKYYD